MALDHELEYLYPDASWREPIRIETSDLNGVVCLLCMLRHGINSEALDVFLRNDESFKQHLAETHPEGA